MKKEKWWLYIIPLLMFVGLGHWMTDGGLWGAIKGKFIDPAWWAENTLSLIIFTVVGGLLVYWIDEYRDRKAKEPFVGAHLKICGFAENPKDQDIYWRDAEKYHDSEFEKWKFVKGAVSTFCWISTPSLAKAEDAGWFSEKQTENGLAYLIDFSKINPDVDIAKWNTPQAPIGFTAKVVSDDKPKIYELVKSK